MSNDFIPDMTVLAPGQLAQSSQVNERYENVVSAFDKLPAPAVGETGFSGPVPVGAPTADNHAVTKIWAETTMTSQVALASGYATNSENSAIASAASASAADSSAQDAADYIAAINLPAYMQKANNLSDLGSASTSRANLGLGDAAVATIGVDVQSHDALLDSLAAQTTAADKIQAYSAVDTAVLIDYPTNPDLAITPSGVAKRSDVKTYIDGIAKIKLEFTSTAQTITSAGLLTLAHGLGVEPKIIKFYGICTSADQGYSIGDIIELSPIVNTTTGTTRANAIYYDTTNIYIRFSSDTQQFVYANKTTGAAGGLTSSKWDLYVRAFS